MDDIAVGIIGYGLMGQVHASIFDSLPGVRVAAIAEPEGRPPSSRQRPPVWYADYRRMFREQQLQAISICTPELVRMGPVEAACECGVDLLIEKPLAVSVDDALRIAAWVERANVLAMVGHNLRFMDLYRGAKQALRDGAIGSLNQIISTRVVSAASATRIGRRCSLALFLGVHDCDLVRWLADSEPVQINAVAAGPRGTAIDHTTALIEFANGVTAYLNLNWAGTLGKPSEYSVEMHGSAGTYTARSSLTKDITPLPESLYAAMRAEIEHFVGCIRTRLSPAIGIADGIAALNMATIIESLCDRTRGPASREVSLV